MHEKGELWMWQSVDKSKVFIDCGVWFSIRMERTTGSERALCFWGDGYRRPSWLKLMPTRWQRWRCKNKRIYRAISTTINPLHTFAVSVAPGVRTNTIIKIIMANLFLNFTLSGAGCGTCAMAGILKICLAWPRDKDRRTDSGFRMDDNSINPTAKSEASHQHHYLLLL